MTIAAKITPTEVTEIVKGRYVDKVYQVRLISAPGVSYIPGTTVDSEFLAFEVPEGTGGYHRQVFTYVEDDVSAYTDDGVALATKATVFSQDGSATPISFSHAAMVESAGSALTLGAVTAHPVQGVPGVYTNIPVQTDGSGARMTVDVVIANDGEAPADYTITLNQAGYDYAAGDTLTITEQALKAAGAMDPAQTGDLVFSVGTTTPADYNKLVSIAQTVNTISLTGGNQTVFYWNLKVYGFGG